jgi:hypothetical protein
LRSQRLRGRGEEEVSVTVGLGSARRRGPSMTASGEGQVTEPPGNETRFAERSAVVYARAVGARQG